MITGPQYKIARRLGAGVYDKTSTPKFAASAARKAKASARPRPKSDYGLQMLEKQRARFSYGINERQFARYVKNAIAGARQNIKADDVLYQTLETRLDNVVYRLGLANSRRFGRQLVSHGHIVVNDVRVTIPSYNVVSGDRIAIRGGSQGKKPFEKLADKLKEASTPQWLKADPEKREASVVSLPKYTVGDTIFDIGAILQFYKR